MSKTANIRQFLTRRCAALGIPVSGIFELTPRCNLQCKMCYVRLTPEEMAPIGRERSAQEWIELAKDAKDAGMTFLLITGGEPTLREDFCQIYEALAQMGFSISVNTNGTMLGSNIRTLWHKMPPSQVNITLYGTCREDYRQLCGTPGAYDAMVNALDWLKSEGILTHLNATMTPDNKYQWKEYEDFSKNRGFELRMTTYCYPPRRRELCGVCNGFSRLTPEEAAELALLDLQYQQGNSGLKRRAQGFPTERYDNCVLDEGDPVKCLAGRSQFWVNWDGTMSPCGMLAHPLTHPFEGGFVKEWEKLKEEVSQIRLYPGCKNCPDQKTCLNCAAVTYAETGRFDGKPEYMCQFSKAYRAKLEEMGEKL